ncbi:MAG: CopG family transcriptional regulator [Cyanobacteria bacterium P01_F01_bin.56]
MARTSITVPETLLEQFKQYCEKQRRSVSAQVTYMMEEAIKHGDANQKDS